MRKALVLLLVCCFSLFGGSHWKFKDGTGSTIVKDSGSSKLDGIIDKSGKCVWAREDDRGFFLTYNNGGSVIIEGTEKLLFQSGFDAELFFSCDLESIGSTNFACLLSKGERYDHGFSIMLQKDGALLVNINGLTKHFYGLVQDAHIQSKKDTRLRVRYDLSRVSIWINGTYLTSYPTEGTMVDKEENLRIGSCENYPFTGNIYDVVLCRPEEMEELADENRPMSELEKLQNYKAKEKIDPPGTVVISDITAFEPKELITLGAYNLVDKYVLRSDAEFWGGGHSTLIYLPVDSRIPDISYSPGLTGRYDIYISVRSTNVDAVTQAAIGKDYYRIYSTGLGDKHRSFELCLARDVEMRDVTLSLAPGNNAYVGYFKLIPSDKRRENEEFDPAGRVEQGPRMTDDDYDIFARATNEHLFATGIIRERFFVEERPCARVSERSEKRGFQLFERNWMDLLFRNSVPVEDTGRISLKVSAAPGEYEPVTFAVRGLRNLKNITVKAGEWRDAAGRPADIETKVGIVEFILKRTTSYRGNGEVMDGPIYIENSDVLSGLSANESRQFWLTIRPPQGTPAGSYQCSLQLTCNDVTETVPLALEVYPFELERPGVGLSFWGFPTDGDDYEVEAAVKDFADHGMTILAIFAARHVFAFKGDTVETAAIDWDHSRLPFFMECCRKYRLDDFIILEIPGLYNEAVKYGEQFDVVFERFIRDIEQQRIDNSWPVFYYENFDEVLSVPSVIPKALAASRVMFKVGVPISSDHIWYKTSRPYQEACDIIAPMIQIFINRFNTRDLWYVDTWKQMQERCNSEGKLLIPYNSNNAVVFSQPAAARYSYGWFHRTAGAGTAGHIMYTYNEMYGSPYNDLDGHCTDWLCNYPKWGSRNGGPSLDWEAYREGADDLRYIATLEARIKKAEAKGIHVEKEQALLKELTESFDMNQFYEESMFISPKWDKSWEKDGKYYASGTYNVPNGWSIDNYDAARAKIAGAIIAIDKRMNGR